MDSLARLVCLIIVPDGLFVSSVHCLSFNSLSYLPIILLVKLLTHIHMVSLITVLNGIVVQFVIFTIIINFGSFFLFVFVA